MCGLLTDNVCLCTVGIFAGVPKKDILLMKSNSRREDAASLGLD